MMTALRPLVGLVATSGFLVGILLSQTTCVPCNCPGLERLAMPSDSDYEITQIDEATSTNILEWGASSWGDVSSGLLTITDDLVTLTYALEVGGEVTVHFAVQNKYEGS